jgi:hypothetical protein
MSDFDGMRVLVILRPRHTQRGKYLVGAKSPYSVRPDLEPWQVATLSSIPDLAPAYAKQCA